MAVAKLQKEVLADRIDAGNVGVAIGDVNVIAAMSHDVVERRPERARGLIRRHAECERQGVGGIGIAQRQAADACNDNKLSHASLLILLERDDNSKSCHRALAFWWSMIFSENRHPPPELGCSRVLALLNGRKPETSDLRWSSPRAGFFGIMLWQRMRGNRALRQWRLGRLDR